MTSDTKRVNFQKVIQANNYTAFILEADHKRFAIYTAPHAGETLQKISSQKTPLRPSSYDLMNAIFNGFGVKVLQVLLERVEDTTYYAKIFLEKDCGEQKEIIEIDARPSDCLILAIRNDIPVYCQNDVIEKSPEFLL